ncbi:uncharacterized protein B0P05DRAFT_553423 [Gilbertella persicaria]|uniref:uncharacterized protein n=1 Tax=Gilbertella persicaria TaxID=101096 RepID=UPI00221F485D|nr:uncharacterized protein B0P05DRAFT_553423 [Gilbertella persicaria]KAI8066215.1 hypothetical protein B0P05DRAFT_553423 [Gilbertella persicaria]
MKPIKRLWHIIPFCLPLFTMSSNIEGELFHHSKRADNTTQIKRQSAANVLQQYSLLAMNSLKDCESPAKTRLKMMR